MTTMVLSTTRQDSSVSVRIWYMSCVRVCVCVCVFMALITAQVLCARSQDLVMSVSVRRVHVVLSVAGFKGGGKPRPKTREDTLFIRVRSAHH